MKKNLDAVLLNRLLIAALALAVIIIGAGFYFMSTFLGQQALKTSQAKIDAELIQQEISRLKTLSNYLDNNRDTVDRAADIVAESQQYRYQDQVINDLNTYAGRSGVSILGFDFSAANGNKSSAVSGLKKTSVLINVNGPVPYDNVLRFVRSIEQNLTKMQIGSIILTPDSNDPSSVANPSIIVEVYIR